MNTESFNKNLLDSSWLSTISQTKLFNLFDSIEPNDETYINYFNQRHLISTFVDNILYPFIKCSDINCLQRLVPLFSQDVQLISYLVFNKNISLECLTKRQLRKLLVICLLNDYSYNLLLYIVDFYIPLKEDLEYIASVPFAGSLLIQLCNKCEFLIWDIQEIWYQDKNKFSYLTQIIKDFNKKKLGILNESILYNDVNSIISEY